MKLNRKGYMLVEIIIAFALTFSIAMYLLNLTVKFKDTNEDIYYSTKYLKDKSLVSRNVMEDIDRGIIRKIEYNGSNEIKFTMYIDGQEENEELRKLLIYSDNGFGIEYGKVDESGNFDKTDVSYYKKTLESSLVIDQTNIDIKADTEGNMFSITIPIKSLYTDDNYDIILLGKSYGEVYKTPIPLSEHVISLYNDGSNLTNAYIGGDTSNPKVSLNSTQGIMLDNNEEYRYYGATPNNYVKFNDELWRIISVSNVKSSSSSLDTVGSQRVKIIREESIGNYSWDSSGSIVNSGFGINEWTKADLMTELNTLYYNSQAGTCYNGAHNSQTTCDFTSTGLDATSRNLIDNALWYLGGSYNNDGLYADDYYTFERENAVYDCLGPNDGACPRSTNWTGKVALMYSSDYVYATDLSVCTKDALSYHTDTTNCTEKNWLFTNVYNQWTLSPGTSTPYYVFGVSNTGYVTLASANHNPKIRPTVYLKPEVMVTGGSGTSTDPYQISL